MSTSRSAIGNREAFTLSNVETEHCKVTNAGWSYRLNDRGWVIYRHLQTGRWQTLREAMALLEAGKISLVGDTPDTLGHHKSSECLTGTHLPARDLEMRMEAGQ